MDKQAMSEDSTKIYLMVQNLSDAIADLTKRLEALEAIVEELQ